MTLTLTAATQRAAIVRELVRMGERLTTGIAHRQGVWVLFEYRGPRECVVTEEVLSLLPGAPVGGLWEFLESGGLTR